MHSLYASNENAVPQSLVLAVNIHTIIGIGPDELVNGFPDNLRNSNSQLFVYSRCSDLAECWERVLLIRFVLTVGFTCDDLAIVSTITLKPLISKCDHVMMELVKLWPSPAIPTSLTNNRGMKAHYFLEP